MLWASPPEDSALAPRDACPFWGGAGTQALESALSRGACVRGHMASSLGASVLLGILSLQVLPCQLLVRVAGGGKQHTVPVRGPGVWALSLSLGLTRGSGQQREGTPP